MMPMRNGIRISQCLITKNEEQNIERALSWGRSLMWEQIVVDTGSTDSTVEIAKRMGAKVFHFPWIDDFAAAKNYALKQAGGDWIAFLDADEYLLPEQIPKLCEILESLTGNSKENRGNPYLAIITSWLNLDENGKIFIGGSQIRFFRNHVGIRYVGRIHEFLTAGEENIKPANLFDACNEIAIYHTGYAGKKSVEKAGRNIPIMLKELEEHPNNYEMMGYLGDAYQSIDEKAAIEWFMKAIQAMPPSMPDNIRELDIRTSRTFINLLVLLTNQEEGENQGKNRDDEKVMKIMEIYDKAIQYMPDESDFDYIVGCFFMARRDYARAGYHLERALNLLESRSLMCRGAVLSSDLLKAWEFLALCHFNTGKWGKCVSCCVSILKQDRYRMGILKTLLSVFMADASKNPASAANGRQVVSFLAKIYDFTSPKDRLLVYRAAEDLEYTDVILCIKEFFSPEELMYLKKATDCGPHAGPAL